MPRLNKRWTDIQESTGQFADIEPGLYKLKVTKAESFDRQQFVKLSWDVAEGPSAGAYSQSQYPPSDVLSWKESALGMLKHKLHMLSDCNGGWKSTVAFDNDQWGEFVNKVFYAVVRRRLYTAGPNSKNPGADRTQMEVAAWLTPEDFAAGKFNPNLLNDRDTRDKQQSQQPVQQVPANFEQQTVDGVYDEDIPF